MSTNNQVFLHGRLTKDPELRQGNTAVCRFSVATDEGKNHDGDKISEFHNVKAFGNTAEAIARNFHKGAPIIVWGRNHTDSYEKDGHKVYSHSVIVERFGFPLQNPKEETYGTEKAPANAFSDVEEDFDLPF